MPVKIIFFLESLQSGGKERRSLELIQYLLQQPGKYEIEVVLTEDKIHFEEIYKTGLKINILKRKGIKYDPGLFFRFYTICRRFNPDIIHTWGKMTTFYAIPSRILLRKPLISSLIADSKRSYGIFSPYYLLLRANVSFSDFVLANSKAGMEAYKLKPGKSRVIHNGVSMKRFAADFDNDAIRRKLGVKTRFMVVMVAGFSKFKDYDLFVDVAHEMGHLRKDVSFVAVGDGTELERIRKRVYEEGIGNIILAGRQRDVETIVASSDIGLLCTKAEGISNSIIEYMALGKPVIATDLTGGSRELILEGETGFCTERNAAQVVDLMNRLFENDQLRLSMGEKGKERIKKDFSIQIMGERFCNLYSEALLRGERI